MVPLQNREPFLSSDSILIHSHSHTFPAKYGIIFLPKKADGLPEMQMMQLLLSDSALNPKDTLHCGHLHKSATTNVQVAPSCQEPSCSCFPAHQRFLMHKVPTWPKGLASPLWRGLLSRFSPSSLHAVLAHFLRISARQLPWPEHTFCTSPHPTCCSNVTFSGRPALTLYLKSQSHRSPRLDLFS